MKFFLTILLGLYIFSGNTGELERESSGFSETEEFKFENNTVIHYKNKTTWKDNLGNYGIWDNASTVTLQNNNVINLQGYGKRIFQNNEIIYIKGFRNRQEQQAGVGKVEIVNASSPLVSLTGMSCTYAVNFYEDNAYLIHKCKITEKQKKVLSDISKKKE